MRTERNTVLAGIAALALLAGSGVASAQEPQNKNTAPKQPQATQEMNKGAPANQMGKNTRVQNKAAPKSAMNSENKAATENKTAMRNRTAQSEQHKVSATKHAMTRTERSKSSRTAERSRMGRHTTTAQRERNTMQERQKSAQGERNGLKGLQGNASGMNVQLSNEQRDRIRTTVLNGPNAPRIGNVNFDVTVGTVIPHGFRAVPVPSTLVGIEPRWRGFLYFVYQEEVVIVNPRNMRIVAVVMV